MIRYAVMAITAGLALLAVFALLYVTGMALGVAAIGLLVIAALGAAVYGMIKWKRRSRSVRPYE